MLPKSLDGENAKIIIKNKDGKQCPYFFADTPLSKRLSGLSQIMHDLNHAKELMTLADRVEDSNIAYSLWMSAIVTYGKCFASAEGRRVKLEREHVKRFNSEAIDYHDALIAQRNEYFAHAGENAYETANVGVILAPEDEGREVLWVNHLMVKKSSISSDEIGMFNALCEGLYDIVEKIGEEVHKRVLNEYRAMNIDELYQKAYGKT